MSEVKKSIKNQGTLENLDTLLISGDLNGADALFKELGKSRLSDEDKVRLEKLWIRYYWACGNLEMALRRLKSLLKKNPQTPGSSEWAESLMMLAGLKAAAGRIPAAEKDLKQLLETLEEGSDLYLWALLNQGCLLRDSGQWDQVQSILEQVINHSGSSAELITRSALVLAQMNADLERPGVVEWAGIAVKNGPRWSAWDQVLLANIIIARTTFRNGYYGEGLRTLHKSIQESDQIGDLMPRIRARLALAEAFIEIGDHESARTYLTETQSLLDSTGESGIRYLQPFAELLWFRANDLYTCKPDDLTGMLDRLEIILAVIAKYSRPPGAAPFWLTIGKIQAALGLEDSAKRSLARAQEESVNSGSLRIEAASLLAASEYEWHVLPDEDKLKGGSRNKILARTGRALECLSTGNHPETEWRVHYLRGKIFSQSGEQYPANSELETAGRILTDIIQKIKDPSLQKLYRSAPERVQALEYLHPYLASYLESEAPADTEYDDSQPVSSSSREAVVSRGKEDIRILQLMLDTLLDLHSAQTREILIQRLLTHILQVIHADRVMLHLDDSGNDDRKDFVKLRTQTVPPEFLPIPESWLHEIRNAGTVLHFKNQPDDTDSESRTVMAVTLRHNGVIRGFVYTDRPLREKEFSSEEADLLRTMIHAASVNWSGILIRERLAELTDQYRREIAPEFPHIIGESDVMKKLFLQIQKVAPADIPILIQGATGTGKDLVARTIHDISDRKDCPFVYLDCSAIPMTLLEAELFGIEKGIATGVESRVGLLEYANGGTILLDEVADIPLNTQAKLLRVLQEREFEPVGSDRTVGVDVRIISTTSQNLRLSIQENIMREDFFYRISGVVLELPYLRHRQGDIVLMARMFLKKYNVEFKKSIGGFSQDVLELFSVYAWPGNVRELNHVIRKAVLFSSSNVISIDDIHLIDTAEDMNLSRAINQMEVEAVQEALVLSAGDTVEAADLLGITKSRLNKIKLKLMAE